MLHTNLFVVGLITFGMPNPQLDITQYRKRTSFCRTRNMVTPKSIKGNDPVQEKLFSSQCENQIWRTRCAPLNMNNYNNHFPNKSEKIKQKFVFPIRKLGKRKIRLNRKFNCD